MWPAGWALACLLGVALPGLRLDGPRSLPVILAPFVRTGADVGTPGANRTEFRYPSYVQHIMG